MRVVWMNSGGPDCDIALQLFKQDNPTAEVVSVAIEVPDTKTMEDSKALADKYGLEHVVLPTKEMWSYVHSLKNPTQTTTFWYFEVHYRGCQYANTNGFDMVLSGGDGRPLIGDIEKILQDIMDVDRFSKKVKILRPMRNVKDDIGRAEMRARIRNPR